MAGIAFRKPGSGGSRWGRSATRNPSSTGRLGRPGPTYAAGVDRERLYRKGVAQTRACRTGYEDDNKLVRRTKGSEHRLARFGIGAPLVRTAGLLAHERDELPAFLAP